MNRRAFIILVAIIAIMSAVLMSNRPGLNDGEASAFLPGLDNQLNDVTRLIIKVAGNRTVATLNRGAEHWTVAERNNYPADVGKIRDNLIALANATVVEEKTAEPTLYGRLGVEDIASEAATGVELIIESASQSYRVIVGKTGVRGDQAYARLPDSAVSVLITARLELATETSDWLDDKILDIPSSDVFRVTISHPDGETIEIEKPDAESSSFRLVNLPADAELAYANVADSIGSVLSKLTLDDVTIRTDLDLDEIQPITTRFETFDGLIITANVYTNAYENETQSVVSFNISTDTELASRFAATDQTESADSTTTATAAELTARFNNWLFILPSHKQDQLTRHMSDLLK